MGTKGMNRIETMREGHGVRGCHGVGESLRAGVAGLFPGYFALVMATGIVSLSCHEQGWKVMARVLFDLNIASYLALWLLTGLRLCWFPRRTMDDLTHHSRGASFLTKAAATCVLGSQFAILTPFSQIAYGLWLFGFGLGLALSYTFFTAVTFCEPKPRIEAGISGSWLLVIVSTESISILGTQVAQGTAHSRIILFASLASFLCGAMLYVFFATLILYRWIFFSMPPERLTPDYWIDMGALAITALAGTVLLQRADSWEFLKNLEPFLSGATLFFWATATWWIPLLLTVETWRHVRGRVKFEYGPGYWALVFPLGMYATATCALAQTTGLSFLGGLARAFACIAFAAWAIVFIGMLRNLLRLMLAGAESRPGTR